MKVILTNWLRVRKMILCEEIEKVRALQEQKSEH
jgi:hypothetical protein